MASTRHTQRDAITSPVDCCRDLRPTGSLWCWVHWAAARLRHPCCHIQNHSCPHRRCCCPYSLPFLSSRPRRSRQYGRASRRHVCERHHSGELSSQSSFVKWKRQRRGLDNITVPFDSSRNRVKPIARTIMPTPTASTLGTSYSLPALRMRCPRPTVRSDELADVCAKQSEPHIQAHRCQHQVY